MADLAEAEAAQPVIVDPARERFRRLPEQVRGSAPQDQEPRPPRAPVREHAEDRKQVRPALHLVDDDKTPQLAQHQLRILGQAIQIGRPLQIQPMNRPRVLLSSLEGQCRLADLARPQDGDHGKDAQPLEEGDDVLRPGDHRRRPYHENSAVTTEFTWYDGISLLALRVVVSPTP